MDGDFTWGVSDFYPGRAHLVPEWTDAGLCGMPVHACYPDRPAPPALVCPECALAFVRAVFPARPLAVPR